MGTTFRNFFLEYCFRVGSIMVGLWVLIDILYEGGIFGHQQLQFILWGYQLGVSGGAYMVVMTLLRYTTDTARVRVYHVIGTFAGLCIATYAGATLWHINELLFKQACTLFLLIPPLVVFLTLALKTYIQKRAAKISAQPETI
jgi:hypothetical protein